MNKYSHIKHVYFRMTSPYVWGEGMRQETTEKFQAQAVEVLKLIGFKIKEKGGLLHSPEGVLGECNLHCHPMSFSGYMTEELIEKTKKILDKFETNIFKIRDMDIISVHDRGAKKIAANLECYESISD